MKGNESTEGKGNSGNISKKRRTGSGLKVEKKGSGKKETPVNTKGKGDRQRLNKIHASSPPLGQPLSERKEENVKGTISPKGFTKQLRRKIRIKNIS